MNKPYSTSCDSNKAPILKVLKQIITKDNKNLLEIGSGTGQHSIYFAPQFKHIKWTTSDVLKNHAGIKAWLKEKKIPNIQGPIEFEISKDSFPKQSYDLVFTANTLHIMSWKKAKTLFKHLGHRLREGSEVIFYGPFNYKGQFTSESNREFDLFLKHQDPQSGIRSFEDVDKQMNDNGFKLTKDFDMPSNNRILLYLKSPRI